MERRNVLTGEEGASIGQGADFSREGKRMFNSYKNQQTYKFGDIGSIESNPYCVPAKKYVPDYQNSLEDEPDVYMYQNPNVAVKENIPKGAVRSDPKREYAQQLLDQINLKNQKKAEELYEKEQILALRQWEMQQYREEEDRKKAIARQKTQDYRDMLEIQGRVKKQLEVEKASIRAYSEPAIMQDPRVVKNNRAPVYNPITGEPYEYSDEPLRQKTESFKGNEKSLANYGNLVVQARRPF